MKNSKKINFILFALCFIAFTIIFSSSSKVQANTIMKVVNTNCLNARSKPSANFDIPILGTLKEGDLVEVVKYSPTWARVSKETLVRDKDNPSSFKKVTSYKYCHMDYLTPVEPTEYVAIKKLQIRAEKSSSSKLLKTISKGTSVRVISVSNSWVQLSTGGYCLRSSLGLPMYVSGSKGFLYARSGPGQNYSDVGHINEGSLVYVTGEKETKKNGKWAILSDGTYCSMDYLITEREKLEKDIENDRENQGYNAQSDISNRYYSYFTTEPVNLRKGPSTNYGLIKTLDTFTPIIAIPDKDGWYKTIDGEYLDGRFITREIIGIDVYLANFSTDKGMIVLHCSNGTYLKYHCCGGSIDYQTPTGSYKVLKKDRELMSALYPAANGINNMNCSLFFNMSNGYAIHCGDPNYLSHGCVHVEDSIQEKIFNFTNVGCPVKVTQECL